MISRQVERAVALTLGWSLIALGVVGLLLPILQGVLFILLGFYVLSRESRWARRMLDRLQVRFPTGYARMAEFKQWTRTKWEGVAGRRTSVHGRDKDRERWHNAANWRRGMRVSDDSPCLVVQPEQLCAVDKSPSTMMAIPGSRMFEISDALKVYRAANPDGTEFDASQGDGGMSLPGVPEEILDEAHRLQKEHGTGYDKPFGTAMFRQAVVEDYWGLDSATGWGPGNVIAGQGGRDALEKAYEAVLFHGHGRRGDFVVTNRVPWISYNWGPYGVGANVMLAPGTDEDGWALTAEAIGSCVEYARRLGDRRVALLVITSPDNPTGRTQSLDDQLALARAAFSHGIPFVLFDWIYHRVTSGEPHDLNHFLKSMEPAERERCIFLDGITKSLGASNIRNAHLVADQGLVKFIQSRASHAVIPSFHSQAVAIAAYRMGFDRAAATIIEPTNRSREVMAQFLADRGIRHILGDGYYAFLDMGPWLDRAGMADTGELGAVLGERFGLAVVPGVYFSEFGARWIRFSYALEPETTRGATERLWQALGSL